MHPHLKSNIDYDYCHLHAWSVGRWSFKQALLRGFNFAKLFYEPGSCPIKQFSTLVAADDYFQAKGFCHLFIEPPTLVLF